MAAAALALAPALPRAASATTPSYVEPGEMQNRRFSWAPAFDETALEDNGARWPFSRKKELVTFDNYVARDVWGHYYPKESELKAVKGCGVRFKGGELADGTAVDMVLEFTGYEPDWRKPGASHGDGYNYLYATTVGELAEPHTELSADTAPESPMFEFAGFKYLDARFSFYRAGTKDPVKVSGHTSFSDVDWAESFEVVGAEGVFVAEGNAWLSISGDRITAKKAEASRLIDSTATILFECSSFTIRYYGNPWKVGLCCLEPKTLVNFTPENPGKAVMILGD